MLRIHTAMVAVAAMMSIGASAAAKKPSGCDGPDNQVFYVADVQVVSDRPYGPKVVYTLRVNNADSPNVYFTVPDDVRRNRVMAESYLAIMLSRFNDSKFGVEPKLRTGQQGDGTTFGKAYEMSALSFGALPGLCPP